MTTFLPGSLVRCREREWIVLPSETPDLLLLRPLGGSEGETTGIALPLAASLGFDAVEAATFPLPDPDTAGDAVAGRLLRDAARLTLRSGAGPFRSLGRIDVRPRPFQIVPLLMALRLPVVRLLIADDVGIGKTVEAGLIARELLDRGDARRLAVVCPPHLCEQWQRALPPGDAGVFEHYDAFVVSIDFVKSDRRRDAFLRACPELVIVDEVHTAARATGAAAAQQRHALLRDLAADAHRHMLLLTATPHSGVEDAFRSLLELLDPSFGSLDLHHMSEADRRQLARHFVQRRRADVQRWLGADDVTPFPVRESRETTYTLATSPAYRALFDDIYAFARELVRSPAGGGVWQQRVRYWTALALLRCVMSSPAAAEATLKARIGRLAAGDESEERSERLLADYVLDLSEQEVAQDFDPLPVVEEGEALLGANERQRLQGFVRRATQLRGDNDPKAAVAAQEIAALLRDGFAPIVYCRYIATAEYLASELTRRLRKLVPDLHVVAVTGASSEDEREQRVAELARSPRRVLVATDCLSEGINLQHAFDAVLHYDLPWNPNRLEQREGRVDRYGQPAPVVRAALLYGVDNPIDEAVLSVLLRKAVTIHKTLGITVPLPVDSESVVETVVRSLFQEQTVQLELFGDAPAVDVDALHQEWDRAAEREQVSRTRFAQHAIRPEEVAQELYESDAVLGNPATVAAFVRAACERLGAPLIAHNQPGATASVWRLPLTHLPPVLRERAELLFAPPTRARPPDEARITFAAPAPEGTHLIGRTHPLTEMLAEYLLDAALDPFDHAPPASRCGAIRTDAVSTRTTLLVLRLRLLIEGGGRAAPLLAEELVVAGFEGRPPTPRWLDEQAALALLEHAQPVANLPAEMRHDALSQALEWLDQLDADLNAIAQARAAALLEGHRRVRVVTRGGRVTVRPNLPLDVLGLYVLLPVPKGVVTA
jgi:superfamily II DNA or RNA helicase